MLNEHAPKPDRNPTFGRTIVSQAYDLVVQRIHGDFNGLFGNLLCISHTDHAETETGETLLLTEGMELIAFERDIEQGKKVFLVARGRAIPSPPNLQCLGSTWCLEIDKAGVRHVSELKDV